MVENLTLKNKIKYLNSKKISVPVQKLFRFAYNSNFSAILYKWKDYRDAKKRSTLVCCDPLYVVRFNCRNKKITLLKRRGVGGKCFYEKSILKQTDVFRFIKNLLNKHKYAICVGYFGYRLRTTLEKLPDKNLDEIKLPDLQLGVYDNFFVVNKKISYYSTKPIKDIRKIIMERCDENHRSILGVVKFSSNFSPAEYKKIIRRAKSYIARGDIYQVNLSQQFKSTTPPPGDLDALHIFKKSYQLNKNPYNCLISGEKGALEYIISASPECFLSLRDGIVTTKPIKGTIRRGKSPKEDEKMKKKLLASKKDAAELAMIVDIERNDLGKVCEYGSITVVNPRKIEKFPTLFHQVGIIRGKLKKGIDAVDLLKATLPSGSVTGAPKIRAMEIIDELETRARSVYTGAIGYITFDGAAEWSVAIRIIMITKNGIFYNVGGGIVWDSIPENEYYETLLKAEGIKRILDS